ncbi:hypothetical protein [Archaeoglobus sp. JdFR-39]|nr:hypothetical protein [Archaeoglobus sp. JdFR-39]
MVNVFDDRKGSVAHILAGGVTKFVPAMFVIFVAYEFIEHVYLKGKEREANFLGDFFEYSFGAMLMMVLFDLLGCIGVVVFMAFVAGLWYIMGKWR